MSKKKDGNLLKSDPELYVIKIKKLHFHTPFFPINDVWSLISLKALLTRLFNLSVANKENFPFLRKNDSLTL